MLRRNFGVDPWETGRTRIQRSAHDRSPLPGHPATTGARYLGDEDTSSSYTTGYSVASAGARTLDEHIDLSALPQHLRRWRGLRRKSFLTDEGATLGGSRGVFAYSLAGTANPKTRQRLQDRTNELARPGLTRRAQLASKRCNSGR
jgi:hypothetical protein